MIQLEAPISIGGTDYSDEITSLIINQRRNTTTRRPTFGNANQAQKAGSWEGTVTIEFINDVLSTSLLQELNAALNTDSAELAFSGRFKSAVVGTDNPTWSGTMIVTDLDIGGQVGDENLQRKTYPITEAGLTEATS